MPYAYHPIWNGKVLGLAHSGLHQTVGILLYYTLTLSKLDAPPVIGISSAMGPSQPISSTALHFIFYFILFAYCHLIRDIQYIYVLFPTESIYKELFVILLITTSGMQYCCHEWIRVKHIFRCVITNDYRK